MSGAGVQDLTWVLGVGGGGGGSSCGGGGREIWAAEFGSGAEGVGGGEGDGGSRLELLGHGWGVAYAIRCFVLFGVVVVVVIVVVVACCQRWVIAI